MQASLCTAIKSALWLRTLTNMMVQQMSEISDAPSAIKSSTRTEEVLMTKKWTIWNIKTKAKMMSLVIIHVFIC